MAMPSSRQARMTRTAISPRLAMRTLENIGPYVGRRAAALPRDALGRRDVVAETGSTNADLLAAARAGAPDGTRPGGRPPDRRPGPARPHAGRRRRARRCCVSVLLRPDAGPDRRPPRDAGRGRWPRREACERAWPACGAGLKWPNDLVVGRAQAGRHPGRGASWDGARLDAVVVGVGLNRAWPRPLPEAAGRHARRPDEAGADVDRLACSTRSSPTSTAPRGARPPYRARLGTLGRRVRVDLGVVVEGVAVDVADDGRLVVETDDGAARSSPPATSFTCGASDPARRAGSVSLRVLRRHPRRRARRTWPQRLLLSGGVLIDRLPARRRGSGTPSTASTTCHDRAGQRAAADKGADAAGATWSSRGGRTT